MTGQGLMLTEIAPGLTVEDVQAVTDATLIIPEQLKVMEVE